MGRRSLAVIDPGPDAELHVRAVAAAVAGAETVRIVLTHGHADHAAAAPRLAAALDADVYGPPELEGVTRPLLHGTRMATDEGTLVAVDTPGHTREHRSLHWPERSAVFVGDLLLGRGDTTWVAEYPGCVSDYLRSLDRVEALGPRVLYPTHGPPPEAPEEALRRFRDHRLARIAQVRDVRAEHPGADVDELVDLVYGDAVPRDMRGAARESLEAVLHHLREQG